LKSNLFANYVAPKLGPCFEFWHSTKVAWVSSELRTVAQTSIEFGLHLLAPSTNSTTLPRLLTTLQRQLTFKDVARCLELESVRISGLRGPGIGFMWFKHLLSVTHASVHFPKLMRPAGRALVRDASPEFCVCI